MKTITIRDLRQRWPAAEALLEKEGELLVTRDSKPVAKLTRYEAPTPQRERFDPIVHRRRMKSIWGDQVVQLVDKHLEAGRADRDLR